MKKLIIGLLLAVCTISFIGCGGDNAQILITEAQKDLPDGLLLYPPKVLIENVSGGNVIKAPRLMLQNGWGHDISLSLYLERPEGETVDANTGMTYQSAPEGFEKWLNDINIDRLIIPAKSIASIPIKITVPKDIKAPPRWEFDIKVSESGGFVTTALIQRWLITMR